VSWTGKVVHSWNTYTNQYYAHHRYQRIYNKALKHWTYIFICHEPHTKAEALAMGATGNVAAAGWSPDSVYEFDYSGNVVWKWSLFDHLTQNADNTKLNYAAGGDLYAAKNRVDINMVANTGRNVVQKDWNHANSLGYDPTTGYIVWNSREYDESYVIDHDGTFTSTTNWAQNIAAAAASPGGDLVYRFGNPCLYSAPNFTIGATTYAARPTFGTNGATQIWGAHSVNFIWPAAWTNGPALPGAGNILWFDNHGCNNNPLGTYSQLVEVNPHVTGAYATGSYPVNGITKTYVWPESAGYKQVATIGMGYGMINQSNQVVWKFRPQNDWGFSSAHISGAQRLANGNTIGTAGEAGHVIEVTAGTNTTTTPESSAGTTPVLAWEYQNPMYMVTNSNGSHSMKFRKYNTTAAMSESTQLFCSFRYSPNYPGLQKYLIQYPDGSIQPIMQQVGVGYTLTGAIPCRSIPCQYVGSP
jgi:hypothetical protein